MASEKAMYWMVLGVLALSVTNGLVSEHRGWAGRLSDRSIAMVEQASEIAAGYVNLGTPDRENDDLNQAVTWREPLHEHSSLDVLVRSNDTASVEQV